MAYRSIPHRYMGMVETRLICGNDRIADWRTPKATVDKLCPNCGKTMQEDRSESDKGTMVIWECNNIKCRWREMHYQKPSEKLKEY